MTLAAGGYVDFGTAVVASITEPELILPHAVWRELFEMSPEARAARLEELWLRAVPLPEHSDS